MLPSRSLTRAHSLLAQSQMLPRATIRSIPRQTTPTFASTSRAPIISTRQFGTNLRSNGRCLNRGSPVGFLSGSRIGTAGILSSRAILFSSTRRFASTGSTDSASAAASTPSSEFSPDFSSFPDLDSSSLLDLTEKVGYLSNLGLDYGIGPTSLCKYVLEHLHFTAGLPWWASIVGLAVLVRAALFYPTLNGQRVSAKSQELRRDPVFVQTQEQLMEMVLKGGSPDKLMEIRMQQKLLQEQAGVKMLPMLLPVMLQFPIIIGAIRLMRDMAALPVPGLETGGTLWFTDLAVNDPLYILPLIGTVIFFLTFKQSVPLMPAQQQKIFKMLPWVLGPIATIVTMKLAATAQLYLAIAAILQYTQTTLLLKPAVRRWLGMPPLRLANQNTQQPRISPFSNVHSSNGRNGGVQYQAPRTINTTATEAGTQEPASGPSEQHEVNPFVYFKKMARKAQAGLKEARGTVSDTMGGWTESAAAKKKHAQRTEHQRRVVKQENSKFWEKAQEQRKRRGATKK